MGFTEANKKLNTPKNRMCFQKQTVTTKIDSCEIFYTRFSLFIVDALLRGSYLFTVIHAPGYRLYTCNKLNAFKYAEGGAYIWDITEYRKSFINVVHICFKLMLLLIHF